MSRVTHHLKLILIIFLFSPFIYNLNATKIPDFSELADELIPSVVSVSVMISRDTSPNNRPVPPQFPPGSPFEDFFKDFFERRGIPRQNTPPQRPRRNETAQGSGFIIHEKGLIVTNNHVISGASSISVVLHDGKSLQAELVGADAKTDLALLKVNTDIKLKTVKWGNSDEVKVGNWAMAIGNPFGEGFGKLVQGSLEASNINVVQELVDMIETQRAYEVSSKSISAVDEMMRFVSNNL